MKKVKQTKLTKNDDQKRIRKLSVIIGIGAGAIFAGTSAGIAVAIKRADNSGPELFKLFKTKMDVNLEVISQKSKTHLIEAAKRVSQLYARDGLGKYSNDDFKRDFGATIPVPYDFSTMFWFDYREDLTSDKVICDFQYRDSGQTLIKNGRIRISPSENAQTHRRMINERTYQVKDKQFEKSELVENQNIIATIERERENHA